jgi:hypothetical protein
MFAHVVKWSTVWSIVTLVAHEKWEIFHLNIKTPFLDGNLKKNFT